MGRSSIADRDPASVGGRALELSVVIPVYNEAHRIANTVRAIESWLRRRQEAGSLGPAEILVVSDGSRDDPGSVLSLGNRDGITLRLVELAENRGKGAAVREGILESRGARILFTDADLATPIEEAERLEVALAAGADVAIASRRLDDSDVQVSQSRARRLSGGVFPRIVRILTGLHHSDTQCGFKMFRREAAQALFRDLREERFAFDVELLCAARERDLDVAEAGVVWRDSGESSVNLWRDPWRMALSLVRLADARRYPRVFSRQLGLVALSALLLLALARGAFTGVPPLYDNSEGRDGSIALRMVESDHWITPEGMEDGVWRPELGRAPLSFWLTALSFRALGVNEFAARLPSYLCGLLLLALVFRGARLFGRRDLAALSALVLGSSLLFLALWGAVITDMTASLCVAGVVIGGLIGREQAGREGRAWRWGMFLFLGLGALALGPSILLLGLAPLLLPALWSGTLARWRVFPWVGGTVLFFAIAAPWYVALERANPGAWRAFLVPGTVGSELRFGGLWLTWLAGLMPWPLLLLAGGRSAFVGLGERLRRLGGPEWSLVLAAVGPPLLWSFSRSVEPTQALPAFAPAALLLAIGIRDSLTRAAAPRSRLVLLSVAPLLVVIAMLLLPALWPGVFTPATGAMAAAAGLALLLAGLLLKPHELSAIGFLPLALIGAVFAFWTTAAPTVNERDSGRAILAAAHELLGGKEGPIVVIRRGGDSFEFYGRGQVVWIDELDDPDLKRHLEDDIPEVYLLRKRYEEWLTPELRTSLRWVRSVGRFHLYRDPPPVVSSAPRDPSPAGFAPVLVGSPGRPWKGAFESRGRDFEPSASGQTPAYW